MMKEREQYLSQRNTFLEGEIKTRNSISKKVTCTTFYLIYDS